MKSFIHLTGTGLLAAMLLLLPSCEGFLDINTDPNNPTTAPVNQVLPSAELAMAGYMGMSSAGASWVPSVYTHYYSTRSSGLTDYVIAGEDFPIAVTWEGFYAAVLPDLEYVIQTAEADGDLVYSGIAKLLKAYSYSIMVDLWGDIPYSEAVQLNLTENGVSGSENLFPRYDDDATIYPQLFDLIDAGVADLETGGGLQPAAEDFFYHGDTEKWIQFANTLKLKLYTQIRKVENVSDEVSGLVNENRLINTAADDFEFPYGTTTNPDNRNPGYTHEYGGPVAYINPYFFEIMKGINTFGHGNDLLLNIEDPRIPYYFFNQLPQGAGDDDAENDCSYCPSRSGTSFLSIWFFSFNIDPNEGGDQGMSQTVAGLYPVGGPYDRGQGGPILIGSAPGSMPQRLLTYYAHLYLRAELAIEGVTTEDPRALFEQAMAASFAKVNESAAFYGAPEMAQAEIDAYMDDVLARYDNADTEGKLEHIMTQKWIASFGWGPDPYTDYRRTGYPKLHDGNTDALTITQRGREYAVSLPYSTENLNINPNSPRQKVISQDNVFWDVD